MKITSPIPGEGNPLFGDRASGSPLSAAFKPAQTGLKPMCGDLEVKQSPKQKARLRKASPPR
jgi:hypothetical protein